MMIPANSLGFARKSHHGNKQPKVRIPLLVGANMDGSDKLPLFVIGKSTGHVEPCMHVQIQFHVVDD